MIKEYKEVEHLSKTFVKEYSDTWGNKKALNESENFEINKEIIKERQIPHKSNSKFLV